MIGEKLVRKLMTEWFEYVDSIVDNFLSALEKIYGKLVNIENILINIQKENEDGNSPDFGNHKDCP